jgi:hypothetical protein
MGLPNSVDVRAENTACGRHARSTVNGFDLNYVSWNDAVFVGRCSSRLGGQRLALLAGERRPSVTQPE